MNRIGRGARYGVGLLSVVVLAYPFLPAVALDAVYNAVGVAALLLAAAGVTHHRPHRRTGWWLLVVGFAGWVLGDLLYTFEEMVLHPAYYPVPSDALYICSYVLLAVGCHHMVRTRRARGDLGVVLDALIVAVGAGVLVAVFLVVPLTEDSSLSLAGKVVSSAYPIGDILLLAMMLQLWATPGARTASFRWLIGALVCTLTADVVWNIEVLTTGTTASWPWTDSLWLASYVFFCAATWAPSMRSLAERGPDREEVAVTRPQLVMLTCGLVLPGLTLLLDGSTSKDVLWPVVGAGSLALSVLVLARMAGLLRVVQVQAVRLSALARSDSLTGAPNRRTWDLELSRACRTSRAEGTPLWVAMVDLDHFKDYNDTHGHQAGDLLLREAVAAWTEQLDGHAFLARYGGEEFALVLPNHTAEEARARIDELGRVTPGGQTFSAGVAHWDPESEPGAVVALADEALYEAKRSGRNRVVIAGADPDTLPDPKIALQTIIDMGTGREVAVEALSRFEGQSPIDVFQKAHRRGAGPALEAAAIRAALAHRSTGRLLTVNVSLAALSSVEVSDALQGDLSGVLIEIADYGATPETDTLQHLVTELRARGAQIALDNWGKDFADLERILRLRPEVVKVDRSLIQNLDSAYYRATVSAITKWADDIGTTVWAEGIETEEQWKTAHALGIHTGQGFLFGHPTIPDASPDQILAPKSSAS